MSLFFQYALFVFTETCRSPRCLATHSPDWPVNKSKQIVNLVYEDMPTSQNPVVSMNTVTNERLKATCSLDQFTRGVI